MADEHEDGLPVLRHKETEEEKEKVDESKELDVEAPPQSRASNRIQGNESSALDTSNLTLVTFRLEEDEKDRGRGDRANFVCGRE